MVAGRRDVSRRVRPGPKGSADGGVLQVRRRVDEPSTPARQEIVGVALKRILRHTS